jgi:hypothetical protein
MSAVRALLNTRKEVPYAVLELPRLKRFLTGGNGQFYEYQIPRKGVGTHAEGADTDYSD